MSAWRCWKGGDSVANVLKHKMTSGVGDGADATLVRPSNWNSEHDFTGGTNGYLLSYDSAQSDKALWVSGGGKMHTWVDAAEMLPRWTDGAYRTFTELATYKINFETLDFLPSYPLCAQFKRAMPKSWNEGTITFTPYWTASSGSGGVVWELRAVAFSNDDGLDAAMLATTSSTDTLIATNDLHIGPESGALTIDGTPTTNDLVIFQIRRDAAHASDTLTTNAMLLGVLLTFTTDSFKDD